MKLVNMNQKNMIQTNMILTSMIQASMKQKNMIQASMIQTNMILASMNPRIKYKPQNIKLIHIHPKQSNLRKPEASKQHQYLSLQN